jgi:hydroxylaminobenzene mutase
MRQRLHSGHWSISTLATILIFGFAALWPAGASVIPLASQGVRGTPTQEAVLRIIAYSAGPTGVVAFALILWGLRGKAEAR